MNYNSSLDGVRAIAAIVVVASHSYVPLAAGGFIGVDVFFVLSGYLLTVILRQEIRATGGLDLKRFYVRRLARLAPPLMLMLAATYVAYRVLQPETDVLGSLAIAGVYMSHYGMAIWHEPRIVSHTWSLAVEEHFYLIWPLFLLATRKMAERTFLKLLIVLFVAATAWRIADTIIWNDWFWSYYRMDTRMSGLILGGVLAVRRWQIAEAHAARAGLYALWGLTMLAMLMPWGHMLSLQVGTTLVEMAAAALILSLTSGQTTDVSKALSHPVLVRLGVLSYSIYLWHYGMALVLRDVLDPLSTFIIVLTVSVAISELSYRFFETPIRTWVNRAFTAYESDRLRKEISRNGTKAVISDNPVSRRKRGATGPIG